MSSPRCLLCERSARIRVLPVIRSGGCDQVSRIGLDACRSHAQKVIWLTAYIQAVP
jgi:hypothetical protein